ncbi:hypothetical protein BJ912DRAFT_1065343 [Pholiota molesta]|nr:hypothetical protein BJ912DRAFT_1065343 [Pholiota molesta]
MFGFELIASRQPAKWKWARAHPWQSWRERYKKNQVEFDQKIRRYMRQKAAAALEKDFPSQPGKPEAIPSKARRENDAVDRRPIVDSSTLHAPSKEKGKQRAVDEEEGQHAGGSRRIPPVEAATPAEDTESAVESSEDDQEQFGSYVSGRRMFTQEEDEYLIKYIAKYNPQIAGRQGKRLYMTLVENPAKWRWARAHPWQSWRERYRRNQVEFDQKIKRYMEQKAAAALEKEFPSQAEATSSKTRRENDAADRRPIVDSSTLHAPSKEKGKQRVVDEDVGQGAGGSRRILPVEAAAKRPSEKDLDDMRRVAPKPSKPSKDLGEEPQAPRKRPRIEDTNGHVAPSTSKTSNVQAPAEPVTAPVEDTESAVEPLEDDLMQELFGSYVEEDVEEEVEELVPDSQADEEELDTNVQSIYPKLPMSPIAAEPHVPGAFEAATYESPSPPSRPVPPAEPPQPPPAAPPPKKRKPNPRQPADEDPFGTPSEPPSPPPRPRHGLARAGALPVLDDTGFRAALKRPRRSSVGDANTPQWPPKRAKTNGGAARSKELGEEAAHRMDVDAVAPVDMRQVPPNWPEHVHPPRRSVHVNAVASSSKTKLPSPAAMDYQPPQPIYLHPSTKVTPVEIPRATVSQKATVVKAAITEPTLPSTTAKPAPPVPRTASAYALPTGALSDTDPFTAKAVSEKDKGKGRADFALKDKQPLRIDLHKQSLQRRLTNTSLSLSANLSRSTSRTSSSASSSKRTRRDGSARALRKSLAGIGPADPQFELVVAAVEDITQTLARMAAAYGVVEQTAQAAYVRTKSLEKTRFVLQRLREAMVEKEQAIYAAMPELASVSGGEDAEESDEEVPGGLVLRTDLREKEAQRRQKRKESKSPTRSSGRPSLSIRPVLDEEDHSPRAYRMPAGSLG